MNNSAITVCGNVTQDPEMTFTDSNIAKLRFSVACNRSYKKGDEWVEETSFFNCVAWRKLAEDTGDVLEKGVGVIVNGRLEQRSWEDKEGNKRSTVEVVADNVAIQTRSISDFTRKRGGEGGAAQTAASPRSQELEKDPF